MSHITHFVEIFWPQKWGRGRKVTFLMSLTVLLAEFQRKLGYAKKLATFFTTTTRSLFPTERICVQTLSNLWLVIRAFKSKKYSWECWTHLQGLTGSQMVFPFITYDMVRMKWAGYKEKVNMRTLEIFESMQKNENYTALQIKWN